MPSYLDLALLAIVLVSALLSMVRGFTREVLAIASWALAAVASYYFYPLVLPYVKPYVAKDSVATVLAIAAVFFLTLIVVSIITIKLSEAILDSRVGALDRTLGFVFGAARGFLLGVVAFMFFNWLSPKAQPEWMASARSKPLLLATGDSIIGMLPQDPGAVFFKNLHKDKAAPTEDSPDTGDTGSGPAEDASPGKRTDALPAGTSRAAGVSDSDRERLGTIIDRPAASGQARPGAKRP